MGEKTLKFNNIKVNKFYFKFYFQYMIPPTHVLIKHVLLVLKMNFSQNLDF